MPTIFMWSIHYTQLQDGREADAVITIIMLQHIIQNKSPRRNETISAERLNRNCCIFMRYRDFALLREMIHPTETG